MSWYRPGKTCQERGIAVAGRKAEVEGIIEGLLATTRKKIRVAVYMTKYGDGVGLL